jgi:hypothetical protein
MIMGDETMKKLFTGDKDEMAKGYVAMAEINLTISKEWCFAEHEGSVQSYGMDSTEGENPA